VHKRSLGLASLLFVACSGPRDRAPSADRASVDALVAQLAPVLRPEPAGALTVRASETAAGPTVIRRGGAELTIAADDLDDSPLVRVDDRTMIAQSRGLEIVRVVTGGRFEELRRVSDARDEIVLHYRVTLGAELSSLRVVDAIVEALDRNGVARLRTEPAFAVDATGVVRPLAPIVERRDDGDLSLRWSLDARGLRAPIAVDPAWTTTASLAVARYVGDAFPLPGKKVFVVGGQLAVSSTEIYDDATSSFTMGPSLSRVRTQARAAKLTDGRIMIAGGIGAAEDPVTADVYSPTTNTVTKTAGMPIPLAVTSTAALPGGAALVTAPAGALVWNPTTGAWTSVGPMITPRRDHHAFPVASGNVVLVGGRTPSFAWLSSAELFDAGTKTFSALPAMPKLRVHFTSATSNGKIYLLGGDDNSESGAVLDTTDVFDPVARTWTAGPKMSTARRYHGAARLPDGRVLVAAGESGTTMLRSAEILDFTAATTTPAGLLNKVRASFPLVPIVETEARLLAISGYNGSLTPEVELFAPIPLGSACTGTGECVTGTCVDGVCCEKPACAEGETCGGASAPGRCRAINGRTCTSADQCASGQCVDGVCCNSACTGVCQACDVATTKGSCTTLQPGDSPHGPRAKCPGSGACQGLCGGVDPDKCTVFPGASTACGDASCKDGEETPASFCDGAGGCAVAARAKCEPFACGELSCKRACAVDADCATGFSCDARTGRCVFGAKCDGDHMVIVPSAASIDCTPYKCAGSSCLNACSSTADCVAGTACDTSSGKCVATTAPPSDDGGCSASSGRRPPTWFALLFLLAAGALARRSR